MTPLCKLNIRRTTEKKKWKPSNIRTEIHIEHVNKQRVNKIDQQSYIAESKKEIKQPRDNSLCHPTSNKITREPEILTHTASICETHSWQLHGMPPIQELKKPTYWNI